MVDFFKQRRPDELGLEAFMQAALQSKQLATPAQPKDVGSVAPPTIVPNRLNEARLRALETPTERIPRNLVEARQKAIADEGAKASQLKVEQDRKSAFNNAVNSGASIDELMAIDPAKALELQKSQLDLIKTQSQLRTDETKSILDVNKAQQDLIASTPDYIAQSENAKAEGKRWSEYAAKVQQEGVAGSTQYQNYVRMQNIYKQAQANQGRFGEYASEFNKVMLELNPNWGNPDAATLDAMIQSNQMFESVALTIPYAGSISNTELALFRSAVPNLKNTPQANQQLNLVQQAVSGRQKQKARFFIDWQKYWRTQGDVNSAINTDKAEAAWQDYIEHPAHRVLIQGKDGLFSIDSTKLNDHMFYLHSLKNADDKPAAEMVLQSQVRQEQNLSTKDELASIQKEQNYLKAKANGEVNSMEEYDILVASKQEANKKKKKDSKKFNDMVSDINPFKRVGG